MTVTFQSLFIDWGVNWCQQQRGKVLLIPFIVLHKYKKSLFLKRRLKSPCVHGYDCVICRFGGLSFLFWLLFLFFVLAAWTSLTVFNQVHKAKYNSYGP